MAQILIDTESWFMLDEIPTKIIQRNESNYVMINNKGQYIYKTLEQMEELFFQGRITSELPPNSFKTKIARNKIISALVVNEKQQEMAILKRKLIKEVDGLPYNKMIFEEIIKKFFDKHENIILKKPSPITLYRWKKKWEISNHDISGLLDRPGKGGYDRWSEKSISLCQQAINFIYMNRNQNTIQKTLNFALDLTRIENEKKPLGAKDLRRPTFWLIKRLIGEIHEIDKNMARYGVAKTRNIHRGKSGNSEVVKFRQYAEFDATPINAVLLDNTTHALLGRGWITVLTERVSKYPLGIYIGYTPPSCLTVAACLKHALLPKTSLATDYPSIENKWEGYGVVEAIIMDNALENHARPLESMIAMLNIDIVLCGKKSPWQKPNIEGFLKIVAEDAMNVIDGTTFNNIFDKGDYPSEQYAVMTINEFKTHIMKWIVDVYMQKPQESLHDISPATKWRLLNENQLPIFETRALELDITLGRIEYKKITHKGFFWKKLQYASEELRILRTIHGFEEPAEIRINELDLSRIAVKIPKSEGTKVSDFLIVPAVNKIYTQNLTAYLHKINQAWARKHHYQEDETGWLKASADIHNVISSLPKVTNKVNAKSAARLLEQLNPKNINNISSVQIEVKAVDSPKEFYPEIHDYELPDFEIIMNKGE